MVAGILLAASLTLPVCEVSERADRETKSYPGVVKAIACVDIVPQVCAEVLEVVLPDGRAYERKGAIEYVENAANRRTGTSPVYIRLPNPDGHLRGLLLPANEVWYNVTDMTVREIVNTDEYQSMVKDCRMQCLWFTDRVENPENEFSWSRS